jgi:hypothetical protein
LKIKQFRAGPWGETLQAGKTSRDLGHSRAKFSIQEIMTDALREKLVSGDLEGLKKEAAEKAFESTKKNEKVAIVEHYQEATH